jgi:outer membrane protein assembly factor BamB
LMGSRDLDGDGHEEVAYVAALTPQEESRGRGFSPPKLKLWMVLLSGRTGKIIWKQTLVDSTKRARLGNGGRMRAAYVDIDGDSWLDLVVPAVESPSEFQLHGYSGKTGKLLWRHQLPPDDSCKEHQALWNLPDPVASDLDNDGTVEILFVNYHNRNQENSGRGQRIGELVALNATNGQPKWTWETPLEDPHSGIADSIRHRPIPIVLRQPSSGSQQRAVCVWFWGRPGFAVVLDAMGHVLQRIEVGREAGPPWFRVWKHDADQDSTDELFLQRDGCVQAFRIGSDQPLWSWSIPGPETRAPRAEMMGIRQDSKGSTATVRIHVLNTVFGLNAASGKQLWHCQGPNTKMELSWPSWPESVSIVDGPDKDARLPGVVFQLKDMVAVCRQAVADKATPSVVKPERPAQYAASDAVDPRLVRPLPWVSRTGLSWMEVGQLLGNATLLATLLFIVPGRYAFWMLRRRQWGLKAFLLLPVVVMLMVLAIRLNVPYLPAHLASVQAKLILGLVGLPGLMFPLLLIVWGFKRYWGRAAVWLSAALVVALLITVFGLWADRDKLVDEHYSFQGWYIPALIGGYVAGSIMLLAMPCWNFIVYRRRTWQ